jgi:hypothetical protein
VYVWQATGQLSVTHKSGLSDSVAFNWWNTPGTKNITVTARNFAGIVTDTQIIAIAAPEVEVKPRSYHATLVQGEWLARSLTISNVGQGELAFHLAEADRGPLPGNDPDPFGYTHKGSHEAAGPTYQWIEIAPPAGGSGTQVALPTVWQGGYFWPIPLPFTFTFYGREYTHVAIGSRGTLNFKDRVIGQNNVPLPGARPFGEETLIASLWDFLVIDPGAVYYQAMDAMFIVEFYQVSRYGGSGHGTWEIILFENGNILFQYQDVDFDYYWGDQGRSATVGIQGDAITGLQYSFDTPSLSNGLAICFAYPGQLPDCSHYLDAPWLSEDPSTGTIAPDGVQSIDLALDARLPNIAAPGEYSATLVIVSNDPDESLVMVPISITVIPPIYGLTLAPTANAQAANPGSSATFSLIVTNTGNTFDTFDVTTGDHIWSLHTPSIVGPLPQGATEKIVVTMDIPAGATGGEWETAIITVTSHNDPAQWAQATLTATTNIIYGFRLGPAVDERSAEPGGTVTYTLWLTNAGNITDTFTVTLSDYSWPTTAPVKTGPLPPANGADIAVIVHVPPDAPEGATDTATVVIYSQGDSTQSAFVTLTTTALAAPKDDYVISLPLVMKH